MDGPAPDHRKPHIQNARTIGRQQPQTGTAATYYEYFEPTKMADKVQTYGMATVNAYWKPSGQIFLWHIMGGTHYWTRRQTAYVYPDTYTTSRHIIAPFVSARRSLLTHEEASYGQQK